MSTASFREAGERKGTQKDKVALSTASVLSLYKPVPSLRVTLAARFYIPFSVNSQIWGCLEATPQLTPENQHFVFRWGCPRLHQYIILRPKSLEVTS